MKATALWGLGIVWICLSAGCAGDGAGPAGGPPTDAPDAAQDAPAPPEDGCGGDCPVAPLDTLPLADLLLDVLPDVADVLPDLGHDDSLAELGEDAPPELPACDCAPPTVRVTVNDIPDTMNGAGLYLANDGQEHSYHLALPTWGFVWNVTADCPCGCEGAAPEAQLATDAALPIPLSGADFAGDGAASWRWDVTEAQALPTPGGGLCARVTDACGQTAEWGCLLVDLVDPTPALHPFQPPDPWVMVWRRDHRTIGLAGDGDGFAVWSEAGANGTWDFMEDLWLLGLGTPEPTPEWAALDCGWAQGGNECAVRAVLEATRPEAYKFYFKEEDGTCGDYCADILFMIEGEAGAPDPGSFQFETLSGDETTRAFSMIGFGGGALEDSLVGLSMSIDPRNDGNEDNAQEGFGCLTTSLFRYIIEALEEDPGLADLAAMMFGAAMPNLGGVPFGAHPEDHLVVDPDVPDGELSADGVLRRKTWNLMTDTVGFGLAALVVHEIGHSVGLVAYGAPPHGLFGGEKNAAFVENPAGCAGAHLDTAGLNLMQAGPGSGNGFEISADLLTATVGFNELNAAYLKGQILILP
jgi:hypothetical protein